MFSVLFSACGKPTTLHPIGDSPLGLYSAIYIGGHWSFVMISGQLARSQFCALRGVARCVCLAGR